MCKDRTWGLKEGCRGDVLLPQGARAFDVGPLPLHTGEGRPACWSQATWRPGAGLGAQFSPAPSLAPFSSVNKRHAFAVANGRGQSSRGGFVKTESWALASSHTSASQVHRWTEATIAPRPQAKEPQEPRASSARWPHCKWHWFWGQHVPRGPLGVPARSALKLPRERDKYTRIAGVPAGRSVSQAPVGAALQSLLPAIL